MAALAPDERALYMRLAHAVGGGGRIVLLGIGAGALLAVLRQGNPHALLFGVDGDAGLLAVSRAELEPVAIVEGDPAIVAGAWRSVIDLLIVDGPAHARAGLEIAAHVRPGGAIALRACFPQLAGEGWASVTPHPSTRVYYRVKG